VRKPEQLPTLKDTKTVGALLTGMKKQMASVLPRHLTPEKMLRSALMAVVKSPILLECSQESFMRAVLEAGQLGLIPDSGIGEAYLVPFWNAKRNRRDVQLIPGYRGLVKLAIQSGNVTACYAYVVKEKDHFEHELGTSPKLVHKPAMGNRGKTVGAYAVAQLRDCLPVFVFLDIEEIEAVRARSQSAKSGYSPWSTDFDRMAEKTAFKRLAKWVPLSPDVSHAVALDTDAELGQEQILDVDMEPIPETPSVEQRIGKGDATAPPRSSDEPPAEPEPEQAQPEPPAEATEAPPAEPPAESDAPTSAQLRDDTIQALIDSKTSADLDVVAEQLDAYAQSMDKTDFQAAAKAINAARRKLQTKGA